LNIGIVGSRNYNNYDELCYTIKKSMNINEIDAIVSGGARGADSLGEMFAQYHNKRIIIHLPQWDKYGKNAGNIRNSDIVHYSDFVFIFWDGFSTGTRDCMKKCIASKVPFTVTFFEELGSNNIIDNL